VKTNYDVNVRVSDKVELDGLPQECNLMVVSNRLGLIIVGSSTGGWVASAPADSRCSYTSIIGLSRIAGGVTEGCESDIRASPDHTSGI
jgi:hypothetical protein